MPPGRAERTETAVPGRPPAGPGAAHGQASLAATARAGLSQETAASLGHPARHLPCPGAAQRPPVGPQGSPGSPHPSQDPQPDSPHSPRRHGGPGRGGGGGGVGRAGLNSRRAAQGRRAGTRTERAGAEAGPRPLCDFSPPGSWRRGREGRRRPRCVNPFGAPGPMFLLRAKPSTLRPGGNHPFLRGGSRDFGSRGTAQGHLARAWVSESRRRSRVHVSPAELLRSRQPIWTRGNRDTTHFNSPPGGPFPSGPIRTFPWWGR